MKKINWIVTLLIALPALAQACVKPAFIELETRHFVPGLFQMTSETYTVYLDPAGKDVRHGHAWQFDSAGNLIAHSTWKHGKVWSGNRADIGLGCGVYARRMHFIAGKRMRTEMLKGRVLPGKRLGFEVDRRHLEFAGRPAPAKAAASAPVPVPEKG